jgi:hypothetical protein
MQLVQILSFNQDMRVFASLQVRPFAFINSCADGLMYLSDKALSIQISLSTSVPKLDVKNRVDSQTKSSSTDLLHLWQKVFAKSEASLIIGFRLRILLGNPGNFFEPDGSLAVAGGAVISAWR